MIEDLIKELTEAVRENTEVVREGNAARAKAVAEVTDRLGGGTSTRKPSARDAESPEETTTRSARSSAPDEDDAPPERTSRSSKPKAEAPARGAKGKAKKISLAEVKAELGAYMEFKKPKDMTEAEHEDELDARADFVVSLFDEFGAEKVTQIDEADYPRVLRLLNTKIETGECDFSADEPEETEETTKPARRRPSLD